MFLKKAIYLMWSIFKIEYELPHVLAFFYYTSARLFNYNYDLCHQDVAKVSHRFYITNITLRKQTIYKLQN